MEKEIEVAFTGADIYAVESELVAVRGRADIPYILSQLTEAELEQAISEMRQRRDWEEKREAKIKAEREARNKLKG